MANLGKFFRRLGDTFKGVQRIEKVVQRIPEIFDKVSKIPMELAREMQKQLTQLFTKLRDILQNILDRIVQIFRALFSYITCGVNRIVGLPNCWYWYALEMLGKLLYFPISCITWFFSLQAPERAFWAMVRKLDAVIYRITQAAFAKTGVGESLAGNRDRCPANPFQQPLRPNEDAAGQRDTVEVEGIHITKYPSYVRRDCYACRLLPFT